MRFPATRGAFNTAHRRAIGRLLVVGLLGLAQAACGPIHFAETGYTRSDPVWGSQYGYREKQLGPEEFSVVATGNPLTSRARVAEIALLRAADLTLEHGRSHFLVQHGANDPLEAEAVISLTLAPYAVVPVAASKTEERIAVLLIRLLPDGDTTTPEAIDAKVVVQLLGARLGRD